MASFLAAAETTSTVVEWAAVDSIVLLCGSGAWL